MKTTDIALSRFEQGWSCAQAVFSALAERSGFDPLVAASIAAGLGGGLARTGGTCGCVSAGIMAMGLANRIAGPEECRTAKAEAYEAGRRFMREFAARNGSTQCRDLLGCEIGSEEGYAEARRLGLFKRRCPKLLGDAVEIALAAMEG